LNKILRLSLSNLRDIEEVIEMGEVAPPKTVDEIKAEYQLSAI